MREVDREPDSVGVGVTPAVLLLVAASVAAAVATHRSVETSQEVRFAAQTQRLDAALRDRINAYVQVLRGSLGLMRSSGTVSRTEWDDYVTTLRLDERYPGFKSLSWAPAVERRDLRDFVARVRRERVPAGFGEGGMPVGLQLIGNYFREGELLHAAHAFQQATDFHDRTPEAFR